jgi:hypothetical protein
VDLDSDYWWPDFWLPPINLYNVPTQNIYEYRTTYNGNNVSISTNNKTIYEINKGEI